MRHRKLDPRHGWEGFGSEVTIPLHMLNAGETGEVIELRAGRGLLARMASLGFTPGAKVKVIQNYGRGPLIAQVRGARVALGRGEAGHVVVRRGAGDESDADDKR